jgi:PTH1 family peptidyl-tRNA hydrolase
VKLLVALGNPGEKYKYTRHNAGFLILDKLSQEFGISVHDKRFASYVGKGHFDGEGVVLLKPMTFMNRSGEAVKQCLAFYKIDPHDMIVIYDDVDLEPGSVKARFKGSSGGHNGIKSIVQETGTDTFHRVKLGIGKPPKREGSTHNDATATWVLSPFSSEELTRLDSEMYEQVLIRLRQIFKQSNTLTLT